MQGGESVEIAEYAHNVPVLVEFASRRVRPALMQVLSDTKDRPQEGNYIVPVGDSCFCAALLVTGVACAGVIGVGGTLSPKKSLDRLMSSIDGW